MRIECVSFRNQIGCSSSRPVGFSSYSRYRLPLERRWRSSARRVRETWASDQMAPVSKTTYEWLLKLRANEDLAIVRGPGSLAFVRVQGRTFEGHSQEKAFSVGLDDPP